MATNSTSSTAGNRPAVTQQPRTYQEMLNYLLPTKTVDGKVYVPRITTNDLNDPSQLNDFDHWHGAGGSNPHTHVGDDITFGKLDTRTGAVDYVPTSNPVNQNVSVGAPVGGVLSIVPNSSTNEVRITTPAGVVFSVMHMTGLDGSLNNMQVAPGTPIGTMAGYGAGGVVHVHLDVYQTTAVQNANGATKLQTRYYDPQEVMDLGTTGRYVIKDDMGKKPESAVVTTPASQAFWADNSNGIGAGQAEVTASRTVATVDGVRTVTSTYGSQTIANAYDTSNRSTGGQAFVTDFGQIRTNTGHWLADAQARQNQVVQAAMSVVLPSESYRDNIYNDGGGIPTTGYGYALIIKDGNTYKARPRAEVEASLRLAGVDDAAISSIDFKALDRVATKLTDGDRAGADAITASMSDTVVFSSPAQAETQVANRLAVEYQGLTRTLGGADVANGLTVNQMGATLSLYDNSPKLVGTKLVTALRNGDTEAALYEIEVNSNLKDSEGVQARRIDEGALFSNSETVSGGTYIRFASNTISFTDPHTPYVSHTVIAKNTDGTTTSTGVAIGNSGDGLIAKGDTVSAVIGADGKTLSEVIVHKTASGTDVTERIFDPNGGPPTETSTITDKNGNVVYQMTTRDGQVLGDSYIANGVTYTSPAPGTGYDAWLDPNGHTQTERTAQGVKDSDAHILRYTTPPPKNQVASLDVPDPNTVLADYKQIDRDGVTYTVGPNGTLNRSIPGQPGLMELREADGSGYIVDTQAGTKLAVLRIGDHVDSNDSDRIIIFDDAGHAVDRATQDAPANVFAPMATAATTTDAATAQIIDAFCNPMVVPSGGVQLADAGTGTVSDAGTGISIPDAATPPPLIETSGPDGSDVHFSHYPPSDSTTNPPVALVDTTQTAPDSIAITTSTPASTFAIFRTPETDAALQPVADGIGVINSLTALTHWGAQDDLGHLNALVNLYTSLDRATGGQLPGDLGQVGGYLSLAQSLHNHDTLGVLSSINTIGNGVVDNTLNSALGTREVPYVGTLMALNNFDQHPGQSIGSIVGSLWGPAGSMIGSFIGGMLDGMFGGHAPPPPEGIVHYVLDEHGTVQVQAQSDISGGAAPAGHAAGQLLGVLQSVVDQQNAADYNANPGNNLAIDPSRLPRVGFDHEQVWIELTRPDGSIVREVVDPATVGQRMLQVALDNDALVPQWQIQTTLAHARTPTPQPSAPSASDAPDSGFHGEAATPHASTGATTSAAPVHATQGHAVEAADHKSQTYDTLVVHLSPERSAQVQANIEAITEQAKDQHHANTNGQTVYRDADGDGYFEATQWVDTLDEAGNAQGLLVLDRNHDNVIATADILHLGNADQSNSVAWLDSNGDGKLDASDPAFAAIKIWTDINHDGKVDDGEEHSLQSLQLTSIDFANGQINYGNGQSDTLSATALTADTEGMKATALTEVGEDGKLHVVANAGTVLVHEGYEGKVLVDGKGHILPDGQEGVAGAHWVEKRVNSLEHIATRTGDWEGTEEQAQHRHGEGGNAEGAPTETNATGATSTGSVRGRGNVTTATTMDVGDRRITSDAPAKASANGSSTNNKPTTITVNAGDARITSNPPQPKPVVFVPAGAREGWITEDGKALLQAPQDGLFSAGGMGVLGVVALGAVQQTAFAHTEPGDGGLTWQTTGADISAGSNTVISTTFRLSDDSTPVAAAPSGSVIHLEDFAVVRQIHLGVPHVAAQTQPGAQPSYLGESSAPRPYLHPANQPGASTPAPYLHPRVSLSTQSPEEAMQQSEPATLYVAPRNLPTGTPGNGNPQPTDTASTGNTSTAPTDSTTTNPTNPTNPSTPGASSTPPTPSTTTTPPIQTPIDTTPTPPTVNSATTVDDHLSDPQEDTVLRVSVATLLANDTNATGIAQVGNAQHGTVSLQGGEVVFTPEANYHGPASFAYVVTGQDGGHAAGVASFTIQAVNDMPVAANESVNASEDVAATITQATLLANDTDPDVATDGQTLRVSAVGHASHGTVNILGNGSITFTPDANFHGAASFDYVVNDGNGGTATATATVQVAAVNDVPVALGETITSSEDTTLLLTQAALLANDTDTDVATDGQVLTISAVSNATHGTVSILGNGQIQFVPVANYNGTATFDYVVSDGHGGTATATATVLVGSTDDAPVASGETVASSEDQTVTLTAAALLANDTDVDNTTSELRISRVAAGTGGTVAINAGNVVFTPTANFNGTASFTYWVKDPAGLESNAATVTLNVAPVNDSPYAQGEVVSGASEDAVFHIDRSILLANDGDVEDSSGSLSIELVGNATHGTVTLDGSGNVVYTPTANFNGTASFQYQVRDSGGAVSPVVSADIAVAAVNDLPIAVDDQFVTYSDLPTLHSHAVIGFNELVGNDLDADYDPLTVSAVRNAINGSVVIENGAVSFTPTLGFSGMATFEYQVDDQHGGQTWAKAFVTVKEPPNGYPTMSVVSVTHTPNYYFGLNEQLVSTATHASVSPADDGGTGLMSITYFGGSYIQRDKGSGTETTFSLPTPSYSLTDVNVSIGFIQSPFWDYSGPLPELVSFETSWQVVDDRGLANIWHFSYSPTTGYQSSMEHTGFIPPVVLGLDGNAPHYIETSQSNVRFDLNGDGVADPVAWAAPGSGVLGIDLNGDHRITNASEFAFTQYTPGAKTDLEGLRAFDTNHNGVLDAADAQWGQFGVWEDKNSDGQTQEGEYQSLDQLGLASINLSSDKDTHAPVQVPSSAGEGHLSGVAVMGESSYTRTDGRTGVVHDAMFAFDADRELAEVRRMALQFNQFCNTAQSDHAPLGFVPIAAADDHGMTLPWLDGAGVHPSMRHEEVFA